MRDLNYFEETFDTDLIKNEFKKVCKEVAAIKPEWESDYHEFGAYSLLTDNDTEFKDTVEENLNLTFNQIRFFYEELLTYDF